MKKAIAVTELVIILLAIGAGIGLLLFSKKAFEKTDCLGKVNLCKSSYLFYKQIKAKAGSLAVPPKVDCTALSPPNCEEKELKATDKTQTMTIIAENLRYCWDKTLGMDNTIGVDFGEVWGTRNMVIGERDVDFCLVCSEFTPNVDIETVEWNQFLDQHAIPDGSKTYEQLITPKSRITPWKQSYRDYSTRFAFEKGKKYYVVSVDATETEDYTSIPVYIYIDSQVYCGDKDPQVHYQLK